MHKTPCDGRNGARRVNGSNSVLAKELNMGIYVPRQRFTTSRRNVLKGTGAAALAAAVGSGRRIEAKQTTPTANIEGTELKILQWSHFVPSYDTWFDQFVKDWGDANGVSVTVDHVNTADVPGAFAGEIAAQEGHDLVEHIAPVAQYEPSLVPMNDLVAEMESRFGEQIQVARGNSYNPTTETFYAFCHGYAPDPGDYRKSLWEQVDMPDGPSTWQELLDGGTRIMNEQGIQMGIGMSNEIDSNMAAQALLWCFDAPVQDENENIVINSPEAVAAVEFMKNLYESTMTPEVFGWNAASNNQLLASGGASYILNSISAYRSAQETQPDVAEDIFFVPALAGPNGTALANGHAIFNYMIPKHSEYQDTAREFLMHLVNNYDQAVMESKLYNFPSFPDAAPELQSDGGPLDSDPFGSEPADKLSVLKTAGEWTTNLGDPGPANAVMGEMFSSFILSNMMAKAARGDMSPADAVAEAESLLVPIREKWAQEGLVGGGS
jgi:multiple sugar transport system substrate-binding protein